MTTHPSFRDSADNGVDALIKVLRYNLLLLLNLVATSRAGLGHESSVEQQREDGGRERGERLSVKRGEMRLRMEALAADVVQPSRRRERRVERDESRDEEMRRMGELEFGRG